MNIVSISKEKISGVADSFLSKNEYIIINYIVYDTRQRYVLFLFGKHICICQCVFFGIERGISKNEFSTIYVVQPLKKT